MSDVISPEPLDLDAIEANVEELCRYYEDMAYTEIRDLSFADLRALIAEVRRLRGIVGAQRRRTPDDLVFEANRRSATNNFQRQISRS